MFTLVRAKINTKRQHTCRLASSIELRHMVETDLTRKFRESNTKMPFFDFTLTRLITQLINNKDNKWLIAADGTHL